MNFLAAVNRVLRTNSIIRGDDDAITTFSDTQHNASLNLALIAIQDEIAEVVADRLISYEKATSTISLEDSTRVYTLASDFVRFFKEALFYDADQNRMIGEYPGGESDLRVQVPKYKTDKGAPNWWYWNDATTKQVAFYQVPNASYDGRSLSYDYEKDVSVTNSTDTLPFQSETEAQTFCAMAARRHKALLESLPDSDAFLKQDASYITARTRLINLMRPTNASRNYGVMYR